MFDFGLAWFGVTDDQVTGLVFGCGCQFEVRNRVLWCGPCPDPAHRAAMAVQVDSTA